jgi:hypothetical protein
VAQEAAAQTRMHVAVARRNQHLDRLPDQLVVRIAEQPFGLPVQQRDPSRLIDLQHRAGRLLDQQPVALLAVMQGLGGALALGDVDDAGHDAAALRRVDRIQADLDRHLAAVRAHAEQVAPDAHRPHRRRGRVAIALLDVLAVVALRHQQLDRPAKQRIARVAEQSLGLPVDQRDAAVEIDHHHRGRRVLDDQPEVVLGGVHAEAPGHSGAATGSGDRRMLSPNSPA